MKLGVGTLEFWTKGRDYYFFFLKRLLRASLAFVTVSFVFSSLILSIALSTASVAFSVALLAASEVSVFVASLRSSLRLGLVSVPVILTPTGRSSPLAKELAVAPVLLMSDAISERATGSWSSYSIGLVKTLATAECGLATEDVNVERLYNNVAVLDGIVELGILELEILVLVIIEELREILLELTVFELDIGGGEIALAVDRLEDRAEGGVKLGGDIETNGHVAIGTVSNGEDTVDDTERAC